MAEIKFSGELTRTAERITSRDNTPALAFYVADEKTTRLTDGSTKTVYRTVFNVKLFGHLAVRLEDLLVQGAKVRVFGEFYAREYQDGAGNTRISYDVRAHAVEVYGNRRALQPGTADAWV